MYKLTLQILVYRKLDFYPLPLKKKQEVNDYYLKVHIYQGFISSFYT